MGLHEEVCLRPFERSITMSLVQVLVDEQRVEELINHLAEAISREASGSSQPWALVGIRRRGDILADRLAKRLNRDIFAGRVGYLDITLYRDDLSEIGSQPTVRTTDIPFGLDGVNVVLVDDVLMTGRSVRAALQLLMDFGRPKRVWLSVLIDRGGRELPIVADHVGHKLSGDQIDPSSRVEVHLQPVDERDEVVLVSSNVAHGAGT